MAFLVLGATQHSEAGLEEAEAPSSVTLECEKVRACVLSSALADRAGLSPLSFTPQPSCWLADCTNVRPKVENTLASGLVWFSVMRKVYIE